MNKKLNGAAAFGLLVTVGGVLSSPLMLSLLPAHWAAVVISGGSFIQAVTKAIHHSE